MAIKMTLECSRCRKEESIELETLAQANALEEQLKSKAATLAKLDAFVASLPVADLPDLYAIFGEQKLVHTYLCDPKEGEGKRSCTKRVIQLLEDAAERDERKPRTKKEKKTEAAQ